MVLIEEDDKLFVSSLFKKKIIKNFFIIIFF